jgi:hypothetical protein
VEGCDFGAADGDIGGDDRDVVVCVGSGGEGGDVWDEGESRFNVEVVWEEGGSDGALVCVVGVLRFGVWKGV